jgi:MraZ protein
VNLIGEFPVAIDNKGRLRMPTGLLRQLSTTSEATEGGENARYQFVVNRGFEKCLTIYPKPVWDKISEKLSKLNRFNDQNRMFVRSFYLGAQPVETDSADRILLVKPLLDYAALTDEAILVAQEDRIEIWSPLQYEALMNLDPNNFADLANQVMGGGDDGVGESIEF